MTSLIALEAVEKSYLGRRVLRGVHARVGARSLTVLTGPSGSGKTTALNIASGLAVADSGRVVVEGADLQVMSDSERLDVRARHGHVFQRSGLLGGLTVSQNITAPHVLNGRDPDPSWVAHLVAELDLRDLVDRPATAISTGQAQRVAIVRALAHQPRILYADEPTASLDTRGKHTVHEVLRRLVDRDAVTVLLVSHDQVSLPYATDRIELVDGRLTQEATR